MAFSFYYRSYYSFRDESGVRRFPALPACPRGPTCEDCVAVRVCRGLAPRTDARLARGGGHTLRAREQPRCRRLVCTQTTGTHSTTVSPNRARSHGRKPAAHTRSRAGIGARKPAAAHTQPAGGRRRTDDGGAAVETAGGIEPVRRRARWRAPLWERKRRTRHRRQ